MLLLGADGQLGSEWLASVQGSKGSEVKKRECFGIPANSLRAYNSSKLNITNFKKVEEVIEGERPDIIINCAAYTSVDKAEQEKEKARQVNALAVKNLADLCAKYKIKLIHFSTDYVFAGAKEDQKRFPRGYPEEHVADPVNWYGQTKWEGEQAIRNSGCKYLVLRLSWLCGAYGNNFVKTMLKLAETKQRLKVVDDQMASPTFARNVVKNTLNLIEQEQEGTYHLTSAGLISWADFARAIFRYSGKEENFQPVPSSQYSTEAERPYFSKLSTAKIKKIEGIKLENWQIGLKKMLNSINK